MQSIYKLNSHARFTLRRNMANYKVLSNNCTLGKKGATIDSANNTSANYDALVEGGHLEEVKAQAIKPVKDGNQSWQK